MSNAVEIAAAAAEAKQHITPQMVFDLLDVIDERDAIITELRLKADGCGPHCNGGMYSSGNNHCQCYVCHGRRL
jgi:hypothetical protein